MTVYSFYIFDRHTECIYTKRWDQPAPSLSSSHRVSGISASTADRRSAGTTLVSDGAHASPTIGRRASSGADDPKLIFGTVFSLRTMVRKLGGEDDAFIGFRTANYKLHYYETPSGLRLVMLTDPAAASMRSVLHQIYINLWVEYVVKNPLAPVDHKGGVGVRNELFELGLDQFIRGLM